MKLSVDIGRLVFHGADMSEKRAGRIKELVEGELGRRLMQSEGLNSIADGYPSRLVADPINTPSGNNEKQIARQLVDRIARTITGVKG